MIYGFDPRIFLSIAEKLKESDDFDEVGKLRTAIGRAYFAAFLLAREKSGQKFNDKRQHKEVREFYKIINKAFIANMLKTLADHRVDADYYLKKQIDKNICNKCLNISYKIITLVENL